MAHTLPGELLGCPHLAKILNRTVAEMCAKNRDVGDFRVQSLSSSLIRIRVGGCRLPKPSLRRMYSLNWEESTPPPHEHVIQNPLCCNRSNTCSHTHTKQQQTQEWDLICRHFLHWSAEVNSTAWTKDGACSTFHGSMSRHYVPTLVPSTGGHWGTTISLTHFVSPVVYTDKPKCCIFKHQVDDVSWWCASVLIYFIIVLQFNMCSSHNLTLNKSFCTL